MEIAIITDEFTQDPATAFELDRRWGVESYEIRQAYCWRVPTAPAWAADNVVAAVKKFAVKITAISPGLFKPTMRTDGSSIPIDCTTTQEVKRHLDELLPGFFAFAERLGTRNVIVFALKKTTPGPMPAIVVDSLGQAAALAQQRGFQLLLENGANSWADSGVSARQILQAVNSPALRLLWDPANVVDAGGSDDPVTTDYPQVAPLVARVHMKDIARVDGKPRWAMLGQGLIDWPRQLRLLRQNGFAGPITLEPHLRYDGVTRDLVAGIEQYLTKARELVAAT